MQRFLATTLILTMAACGSATQTGPKTTNPPLTADQRAAHDPNPKKPPVEVVGLTLKVHALSFQMTMTPDAWSGKIDPQENGSSRLVFLRKDPHGIMVIIPIVAEKESAQSIAESQLKNSQTQGHAVSALTAENKGRYAFTAESPATDPEPVTNYLGVMPHPTIKDAYLVIIGTCAPKDANVFLKDVRTIADTIGPIQ
jgi:hypothetical protein